jgi:phosphoglycerate dehydrogenase-like enzyme
MERSRIEQSNAPLTVVVAQWQTIDAFLQALTTPAEYRIAASANDEDVAPLLPGADALISARFSPALASAADSLRLILTPGAGTNGIDFAAVPERTTVCNVFGHERGIAEYVFTTMGMLNRDYPGMDRRLREGDWRDHLGMPLPELQGKTVAIVGLGRIGAEVARWASFMRMNVIGVARDPSSASARASGIERIVSLDDLQTILPEADFLVLAVPLTVETTGLIGERELSSMKQTAFLINVARGEVVDEAAFYAALKERSIAGAAIDVWYRYPDGDQLVLPGNLPFHELPNVVMTPHIAGATENTFSYRWATINENLRRLRDGEPLLNVVSGAAFR